MSVQTRTEVVEMCAVSYFATGSDQRRVFEFLYGETDVEVYETYSEFDRELRRFTSLEDLCSAFDIGNDPNGTACTPFLSLWSPAVEKSMSVKRISLKPETGHQFRFRVASFGAISFHGGGLFQKMITKSQVGSFTRPMAERAGYVEGVDWNALKKLGSKIDRFVRRIAVGRVSGQQILAGAFEFARSGFELREFAQNPLVYSLNHVVSGASQ